MSLFGRQGYHATTIAQIERAAGLSPGAGGLYRHFASKRAVLEAGVDRQIENAPPLTAFFEPSSATGAPDAASRAHFVAVARAALRRLDAEGDVNRLLLRDLADFPDLRDRVRDHELRQVHGALAAWLQSQASGTQVDIDALAAVLMSAVSHYWIMSDALGDYPLDVDEERFLATLADVTARMLGPA